MTKAGDKIIAGLNDAISHAKSMSEQVTLPICQRLSAAKPHCNHHANAGLCREARDTIEALYEALEAFYGEFVDCYGLPDALPATHPAVRARTALKQARGAQPTPGKSQ